MGTSDYLSTVAATIITMTVMPIAQIDAVSISRSSTAALRLCLGNNRDKLKKAAEKLP